MLTKCLLGFKYIHYPFSCHALFDGLSCLLASWQIHPMEGINRELECNCKEKTRVFLALFVSFWWGVWKQPCLLHSSGSPSLDRPAPTRKTSPWFRFQPDDLGFSHWHSKPRCGSGFLLRRSLGCLIIHSPFHSSTTCTTLSFISFGLKDTGWFVFLNGLWLI